MRRLNYRFVFACAFILLVSSVALAVLHRWQVTRQVAALPLLGERADAAGKPERAIRFLSLYLAKVPGDHWVRLKLAELLARRAETPYQIRQVMAEFERILYADPEQAALRQRVGELYLHQGVYKEALGHADILLKAKPTDPILLDLKGRCLAGLRDWQRATETYQRAVASPAVLLETFPRLADVQRQLKKLYDADATMDQMIRRFPKSHFTYLRRALYRKERLADIQANLTESQRVDLAKGLRADFAEALRLAPENAEVLLATTTSKLDDKDYIAARKYNELAIRLHPKDPRFYALLAELELILGDRTKAIDALKVGVARVGDRIDTMMTMAELFLRLDARAEAQELLKKVMTNRLNPVDAVRAGLVDARIAMAERDWSKAFRGLKQIRRQITDTSPRAVEIDFDLVTCAANLGLTEERLLYARRAVKLTPNDPVAGFALASALIAEYRYDEAELLFAPLAAEPYCSSVILLEYTRVLLVNHRKGAASPNRLSAAETALNRLSERHPASPEVCLLWAELLLACGDRIAAREILSAACDATPDQLSLWIGLAVLDAARGGPSAAGRVLREATEKARVSDSPDLRLARLRLEYDPSNGFELLDKLASSLDGFPTTAQIGLLIPLAEANTRAGRLPEAHKLLDRVIQLQPSELTSWLYLCDIAAQCEHINALALGGVNIRRLEGPGGRLGQYAEASLLALKASKGDKAAIPVCRTLVRELIRLEPSSPRPYILAARLDEAEEDSSAATANYSAAVRLGDRRLELIRRAVFRLYRQQHRIAEAFSLLKNLEQEQFTPDLRRTAAELSLLLDDTNRAIQLAESAAASDKATHEDFHWLAWVYIAAGKSAQAEEQLRKAILRGGRPDCWVALVRLLAPHPAARESVEAFELLPIAKTTEGLIAAGECRQILGDSTRADAHYKAALISAPDDPLILSTVASYYSASDRFALAEPHLRRLATRSLQAKQYDVATARRELASGLAATGDWARCTEAHTFLDLNESEFPNDPANGAARAYVSANTPGRRKQAIRWYEESQRRQTLTPLQLQTLGNLYDLTGQWLKACVVFSQYPGTSNLATATELADTIDRYLRHNDADGAARWIQRLRQLEPNTLRTRSLVTRAAAKTPQRQEAIAALTELPTSTADDRLILSATWEDVGEIERAEALLVQDAATGTAATLRLLHFYGRYGKIDNAVQLCEQSLLAKQPADAVVAVTLDAIRANKATTPNHYDRIDHLLNQLGTDVKWEAFFRADIRTEQGNSPDAIKHLSRFLESQPNNAPGLVKRGQLALLHEKDPALALQLANRGIASTGPLASLIDLKAAAMSAAGDTEGARAVLIAADGDDAIIPYRLARLDFMIGRRREATEHLQRAKDAGLTSRDLHPLELPLLTQMAAALGVR